jgi:hypothetical protein
MLKSLASLALLTSASQAGAASSHTDFGIRTLSGPVSSDPAPARAGNSLFTNAVLPLGSGVNLRAAASLGSQWGRVTSTIRSVAHNRAVGGVRNSWHLSGRAIDIARRPGVTHAQIAAAFRSAGYYLVESLDEGDHSHFAFGSGAGTMPAARTVRSASAASTAASTQWKIVTVAEAAFR